jgi:hypothetical protein
MYGTPDPLYNALVYVPNAKVEPFAPGVSCDRCGVTASGSPLVAVNTGFDGKFTLKNVPAGDNVPVVIQLGRWRRQVVVPKVNPCVDNPMPADLTRLPRNKSEGDIPQFAIATSEYDLEECVLRKMGIDDAEFTTPAQPGRVHIYAGQGQTLPNTLGETALWTSADTLKKYDIVLLPCSYSGANAVKTSGANLLDYANAGGRIFVTDLSHSWLSTGPMDFVKAAKWVPWGPTSDPLSAQIDTTFPKGQAMADWMQLVGATTSTAQLTLHQTFHVVDAVNPPSARWIYSTSPATLQTLSFNTPVSVPPADQCGRVVYSNFHVAIASSFGAGTFPDGCNSSPLTPQEKALEFMLFDVGSCLVPDSQPPPPPPAPPVPPPPPPPPPPPR